MAEGGRCLLTTMNFEIIEALGQIAREKNVNRELVLETLEAGLVQAAKRRYGDTANIAVHIDPNTGEMDIEAIKTVVAEVGDPDSEIPLAEASRMDPAAAIGGEVIFPLDFADFGRNAILMAKQILIQRVREAERERIYKDYIHRVGEVVTGNVQQISRGDIIVNLGRAEALLPQREQIRRERFRQGDTIRAYVIDVQHPAKGPQVLLSRAHPRLLERLFDAEVPEIRDEIVEIRAIAREPGERSKIMVLSHDQRVDAVGACVGMRGARVQAVVRELNNERVDIINYSDDPLTLVSRALTPATVSSVEIDEHNHRMSVQVDDDQLSLAIGRQGQNARLVAMLTGWSISIISRSQREAGDQLAQHALSELKGIGDTLAERLVARGYETVKDIHDASVADLEAVPGIGTRMAERLIEKAEALAQQLAAAAEVDGEEEARV
jgi:N utilization substance protein A